MAVNLGFIALSMLGGLTLIMVLLIVARIRPWHYPVRYTEFEFPGRERVTELASRGPSGEDEAEFEQEEAEEPQGLWERMKMGLYTYPKRPSKMR